MYIHMYTTEWLRNQRQSDIEASSSDIQWNWSCIAAYKDINRRPQSSHLSLALVFGRHNLLVSEILSFGRPLHLHYLLRNI